jgi:hypothetical protein
MAAGVATTAHAQVNGYKKAPTFVHQQCPSEERMMETMIPPQVGMRLRTKREKKEKKKKKGKEKKRKEGALLLSFTTLVLQSSTMFFIESLLFSHFHILVGIFHYRTWLVYSDDELPQMHEVYLSKQVGCTPTKFS